MQGIRHLTMNYKLKEGTSTSYYFISGDEGYLPNRVCITNNEFAPTAGRLRQKTGQFKATFNKSEASIYRKGNGTLHSSIYKLIKPRPSILGTGDLQGTRDLLIFQYGDDPTIIIIHLFMKGLFQEAVLIDEVLEKAPTIR